MSAAGHREGPRRELARIVSLLVDSPRSAHVDGRRQRASTVFQARVADEDLGMLIGRQGRTARALRTLLEVRGECDGRRYGFEICED